nr:MAG TPA: hypothetical protein [Caudoviricetes sp.]
MYTSFLQLINIIVLLSGITSNFLWEGAQPVRLRAFLRRFAKLLCVQFASCFLLYRYAFR